MTRTAQSEISCCSTDSLEDESNPTTRLVAVTIVVYRLEKRRQESMTVMNRLRLIGALAAAMALAVSSPAWSHHSHAMFDHEKVVTISGTVAEWVFRNPHVFLYVNIKTDRGETVKYAVEMSNITNMLKVGFSATTFKTLANTACSRKRR